MGRATLAERLRIAGCVFADDEAELLLTAATTPEELEQMVAVAVDFEVIRVALVMVHLVLY